MCQTNDLSLVNMHFQHSRARLTTWHSPDHQTENTIDYVLTRKKDRSSATDAIALGGADADSDHKLLKATFRWKWRSKRTSHATARVNVHPLASLKEQFNNTTADYAQESDNFEQALISASKDVLTTRTANRGNKFISDETLELIGKKLAAWKRRNEPGMIELYRTLQRSVKQSLRADEEKWADNLCSNINAACDQGDAREMHKLTKELLGEKGNVRKRTIKDQHGAVIADEEGQLARWHQYCKSLFRSDLPRSGEQHLPANDDNALSSTEIKQAIKKMKNGKAAAADGLRAEMFKALTDENLNCLVEDVKAVWSSGEVRDHWRCAELLPFYKNNGDSGECQNYCTIAIIPQYSKIVLVCIANRLKDKVEEVCSEAQFGFRASRGTADAIFVLRSILQQRTNAGRTTAVAFIDFEKAFDRIPQRKLWLVLLRFGVESKLIDLLSDLYEQSSGFVKWNGGTTEPFSTPEGCRQGCPVSPLLFILYLEFVLREWRRTQHPFTDCPTSEIEYADDTTLLAETPRALQQSLTSFHETCQMHDLKINAAKTKWMWSGPDA